MSNLRRPLAIVVLVLVAVLAVEGAVLAAGVGRNGKAVTAVRTVTKNTAQNITSSSWIDVADMKTFITVPKDQKAILLVTYSADTTCAGTEVSGGVCAVRVTLDGQEVSPGSVQWSYNYANETPEAGVASMQWVAGPVATGDHQIKVQAALQTGSYFYIGQQTLSVLRSRF
jgi:hypothetical protein